MFLTRLIPRVCRDYGYEQDVIDRCLFATTEDYMYARCEYNYKGATRKLYKIKIQGTTFSGHPTRTTLGNSLRTASYVTYLAYKLFGRIEAEKIFLGTSENVILYVAGDDVIV